MTTATSQKKVIHIVFILSFACLLTIVFLWPILTNISSHLASPSDGILIAWIIQNVSQSISSAQSIYQLPFFHPYSNTLTYSDPFFSTAIIQLPLNLISSNIILKHNLHLLLGNITLFLSMYWLMWYLYRSKTAAIASSLLFVFSSIHLRYTVHLHTFLLAGIPLSILGLFKYHDSHKFRWLVLFGCSVLYQSLNAPMTGFFLGSILLIILSLTKLRTLLRDKKFLLTCLTILSLCILFYLPYFHFAKEFDSQRSIHDAAHFSLSLNQFFIPEFLFIFALLVFIWFTKHKPNSSISSPVSTKVILIITLTGFLLALGPVLRWFGETVRIFDIPIPLPYAVFYYLIPGFNAFRASSRWIIVFGFGLSWLIAKLLTQSSFSFTKKAFILLAMILVFWFSTRTFFQLTSTPATIPQIYSSLPKSSVILAEFPMYLWDMNPYDLYEFQRLLYQNYHSHQLYNGVSGFTPPSRVEEIHTHYNNFPNDKSIAILKQNQVTHIVVHIDEYQQIYQDQFIYGAAAPKSTSQLIQDIGNQHQLKLIDCVDQKCLYQLTQ